MTKELLDYHLKLKEEFNEYLTSFNLLFYGYGCKKDLLSIIFPNVPIFNGLTDSINDITELLCKNTKLKNNKNKLLALNEKLKKEKKIQKIIILNFCFDKFNVLNHFNSFRIIATIERINFTFSHQEIIDFNFIFRDLTTFIPYKENFIEKKQKLESDKLKTLENVFLNVQKQSQIVFIELIKLLNQNKTVYLKDLTDNLKSKLMHKEKSKYINLLTEFIDHKIVKINKEEIVKSKISLNILTNFYEKYKNFNIYK